MTNTKYVGYKRKSSLETAVEKSEKEFAKNLIDVSLAFPKMMAASTGFLGGSMNGYYGDGGDFDLGAAYLTSLISPSMSIFHDYFEKTPKKEIIKKAAKHLTSGVGIATIAYGAGYVAGKVWKLSGLAGLMPLM